MSHPEPEREEEQQVVDDVERVGWHGVSVRRGSGWEGPEFYYTVGLNATYDHPELVITGESDDIAHRMAQGAVEAIADGGGFSAGSRSDAVLEGYDVRFEPTDVGALKDWLVLAHWFYGDKPWSALQMLWPDRDGRFPDEDGYDHQSSPQDALGSG